MQSDEVHDWIIHWLPRASGASDENPSAMDAGVSAAIQRALMKPQGGLPLREQVGPGMRVTLAIDPSDEKCPNALMVPAVMDELRAADVRDSDVTVLLAHDFGSFDPNAMRQMAPLDDAFDLGMDLMRYHIMRHDPYNLQSLNQLGTYQHVPLSVSFLAAEADFLIATGSVRAHRQVGYTGSQFTVGIGCAGIGAVNELFGATNLDDPRVRSGEAQGNPVHAAMMQAAQRAGLAFSIECSGYGTDEFVVRAGNPLRVNETMIDIANFSVQLIAPLSPRGLRGAPIMRNPFEPLARPALKSALARPLPTFADEVPI